MKTVDGVEIYEYEDDEEMEVDDEESSSVVANRRSSTNKIVNDSKNSSADQSLLGLDPPIFSPFDTEVFPDPLNWPKEATLRLLSLVAVHGIFNNPISEPIYYGFLAEKMASIRSDEAGLHEYCVARDDWDKIGRLPPIELKPSYDLKPTADEVEEKLNQFYNLEYIKTKLSYTEKPQPFELKKDKSKASSSTSGSSLSRSRRTGRPNPYVEAIVEEKKQHKRGSTG